MTDPLLWPAAPEFVNAAERVVWEALRDELLADLRAAMPVQAVILLLHGAMGTLGEAQSVERFEFHRMVVRPTLAPGRRWVKVAFDGEVTKMRAPLDFRVLAKPLYLLMPPADDTAPGNQGAGR